MVNPPLIQCSADAHVETVVDNTPSDLASYAPPTTQHVITVENAITGETCASLNNNPVILRVADKTSELP